MEKYNVIGKPRPLIDAPIKATGEGKYGADLVIPNMLYGKIFRSPYPHARIVNIDTRKAQKLPGVKAVITGKDTKGVAYCIFPKGVPGLPTLQDQRPLGTEMKKLEEVQGKPCIKHARCKGIVTPSWGNLFRFCVYRFKYRGLSI